MRRAAISVWGSCVVGALVMSGCGPADSVSDEFAQQTAAVANHTFGSSSTVSVGVCDSGEAPVTITGTFTTDRGQSPVQMSLAIDGGASAAIGTLTDANFTNNRSIKTAPYSYTETLANGHHDLNLCFWQAGGGPNGRTTCEALSVDVYCPIEVEEAGKCAGVEFFGNVLHNRNIGSLVGSQGIPVHARGDLGEAPSLVVQSTSGARYEGTMWRAGESCNYHGYLPRNFPTGACSFTVTGNGHTYTFNANVP